MGMDIQKIDGQTYAFDEGGVRFFLLLGTEKALLIDSGMMTRTLQPSRISALGSAYMTSPSPPVLMKG